MPCGLQRLLQLSHENGSRLDFGPVRIDILNADQARRAGCDDDRVIAIVLIDEDKGGPVDTPSMRMTLAFTPASS